MQKRILNTLTSEEERVILHKGTEAPGTGEYEHFTRDGVYLCRHCNAPLYDSKDKFDAHCGWPAFDDEIPEAIQKTTDADGQRIEITCASCGAHLGHVFLGEQLTEKNTRHCVNSLSMRFIPREQTSKEDQNIVLGGGCFWCLDASYRMIEGVLKTEVGYAGGTSPNPTYEKVCTGNTHHAEVVRITYDPRKVSFSDILTVFFAVHDPTTPDRQGNDVGTQYRSAVFYSTWAQKEEAEKFILKISQEKIFSAPIITEVLPLVQFFPAEEYHQDYYAKNPSQGYCQVIINPKLKKLREHYSQLLR